MDHWRRGHKQMCKKIHRGGNAEQYNADKKYKEAVAEAVEACADDMTTIRETEVIARRVLGGAHPLTKRMGQNLRDARRAPRPRNAAGAGELVS